MEIVNDIWHPFLEVLFEEVLQFTGKFDTCGSPSNNNHVKKAFTLLIRLIFEASSLNTVHDALANLLGVPYFFEKAGVFPHTGDAERCILSTNGDDEHVERYFGRRSIAFDFRIIIDVNDFFLMINLGGLSFIISDCDLFVTKYVTDRFHYGAVLDSSGGT